jgi:hypothetical protein
MRPGKGKSLVPTHRHRLEPYSTLLVSSLRRLVRLRLGSARRRSMECALRRMARSLDSLIAGAAVMNKTNPHVIMDPAVVLGEGRGARYQNFSYRCSARRPLLVIVH